MATTAPHRSCSWRPPPIGVALAAVLAAAAIAGCHARGEPRGAISFEGSVLPVLARHCVRCHGVEEVENGLDLRSAAGVLRGGTSGAAVVPGRPADSLLVEMIADGKMPPEGSGPTAGELSLIRAWIRESNEAQQVEGPTSIGPGTKGSR